LRIAQAIDATKEAQIKAHALALAELLYEESDPEPVKTLEGIEEAVRGHWLKQVGLRSAIFYPHKQRYDKGSRTASPKHHRTIKREQAAKSADRAQISYPLESISREVLPASERQ
jgi:hypothetical protein